MAILRGRWLIILSFIIAFLLDVLPLPGGFIWLRPAWTLLVLIYWIMALPENVGLFSAFVVGLILDLLQGTLLGEHAFAMVCIAYFVIRLHKVMRVYPGFQQAIIVFGLVFLYKLIIFVLQGLIGTVPQSFLYWGSALISAILWPWIMILLRDSRRRVMG